MTVLMLALLPAFLGLLNLWRQQRAHGSPPAGTRVSILIPARNEAPRIGPCLEAALASTGCEIEVLVMDDGSTDGTAEMVARHPGVRLLQAPPLPPGWTGKVHACARLAEAATGTHLLFIDADVRLAPQAAAAMAAHAARRRAGMVSGVPRQRIGSLGEALTVPFINLLMLGYLPFGGRATTRLASFAAACGQLLLVEREAYARAGGHAAIPAVLHEALALARRFRAAGLDTEIVDGAPLAECRMYAGFAEAWDGFMKNAREGMATPIGLPIWTFLLAGAHLAPWFLLPAWEGFAALALGFGLRAAITRRVREPWWTVPLLPLMVATALALQWTALVRGWLGYPAGWKGRAYPATRTA
ncbi:glycosyltransferase [Roseococcus sp. YIM B11640]|uniref:glycosyltransferase n=1 Tax=Roseococcus sp. YIM B11640 TaxID=3133973 RepID=UPI003C7B65ED